MENTPYQNQQQSLLSQLLQTSRYEYNPQQQNPVQLQPQTPQHHSTNIHHHRSQQQLNSVQVDLQHNYSSTGTALTPRQIQQFVNKNAKAAPPTIPQPVDVIAKMNANTPDFYAFRSPPQQEIHPAQNHPQPGNDDNYKSLQLTNDNLKQQNYSLSKHLKASTEALKLSQDKETNYKSQVDSYELRCRELEKELGKWKSKALTSPVPISNVVFSNLEKKNDELVEINNELREENEKLLSEVKKVTDLEIERDKLANVNRSLTKDVGNLTEQLAKENVNSSKNKELVNENRSLLNKINSLEDDKVSAGKTVESLESEVQSLKKKISDAKSSKENELNNEITNLNNALVAAQFRNKELDNAVSKLEGENKNLGEKLEYVEIKNKELVDKVDNFEAEKSYFKEELDYFEADKKALTEEIAVLKTDKENLLTKVKQLEDEAENQEKEDQEHENEVSEMNEKLIGAQKQIKTSAENIEKLQTDINELKKASSAEVKKLQAELESERERARKPTKPAHNNSYEIERLTRDLKEETERCDRKTNLIVSLREKLEDLETKLERIKPLMNQVETLELDKNYLSGLVDGKEEEMKRLRLTIDGLNRKISGLIKSNDELDLQVIQHKITIGTLEKEVEDNLNLIRNQENEIENQKLVMSLQKASCDSSYIKMCKLVNEAEENARIFKEQEEKINSEIKRADFYSSQLQKTVCKNTELKRKLDEEEVKNNDAREELEEKKKRNEKLSRKVEKLEKEMHKFRSLREKTSKVKESEKKIHKLKKKKRSVEEKPTEKQENAEKCAQLDRVNSEVEKAKIQPFTITSKNMKCVSNSLAEDSDDDGFSAFSTGINPAPEKKKHKPNHDGAGESSISEQACCMGC